MTADRGAGSTEAPIIACYRATGTWGASPSGHGLWLLDSVTGLPAVLAGDPAAPLPPGLRERARMRIRDQQPLACQGLQRVEIDGPHSTLTFAIGLGTADRRRLLAWFDPAPKAGGIRGVAARAAVAAAGVIEAAGPTRAAWPSEAAGQVAPAPGACLVVGAGLAGLATASALARRGHRVLIVDGSDRTGGALVDVPLAAHHPALSADANERTRLARSALLIAWRLRDRYGAAMHWCGRDQRIAPASDRTRLLAGWPAELARADGAASIRFDRCGLLDTAAWFDRVVADPAITVRLRHVVAALDRDGDQWWGILGDGARTGPFGVVVIACPGHGPLSGLLPPWTPAGRIDLGRVAIGTFHSPAPATGGARIVGGSRSRGEDFRIELPPRVVTGTLSGPSLSEPGPEIACHWRLSEPAPRFDPLDHLPLIGAVPDQSMLAAKAAEHSRNDRLPYPVRPGLFVLTGLGGRGLLWSQIGAEVIAAAVDHEPPIVEASLAAAIDPARFIRRRLRRQSLA